ncbi:MAG: hypothetical protein IPJ81_19480 [Chitinophagaceae bacterium]|nr:hypothetical protein [Chitinophagaceae bacterium]
MSAKFPLAININTHLKGNMQHSTAVLNISSNDKTFRITGAADLKNINNPNALQYNVVIKDSRIEKNLIISLVPSKSLPQSIRLPEIILLAGTVKGDMNNVQTNLLLNGSYGTASIKGYINNFKIKKPQTIMLI